MSRYSSISFRAESGTVLSLAMTFTLIMWGVMWCYEMRIFRYGGFLHLGTLLGTKAATWPQPAVWSLYGVKPLPSGSFWHTSAELETTFSCLKNFWEFCWFCWFYWMLMASMFSVVWAAVFVAVAPHWAQISSLSQTHLQPLPVQTQGMQLLKLFIQIY